MDEKITNMMNDPIYLMSHYADCASPQLIAASETALLVWGALILMTSVRFWQLARWVGLRAYLAFDRYLVRRRLAHAPQPAIGPVLDDADEDE